MDGNEEVGADFFVCQEEKEEEKEVPRHHPAKVIAPPAFGHDDQQHLPKGPTLSPLWLGWGGGTMQNKRLCHVKPIARKGS